MIFLIAIIFRVIEIIYFIVYDILYFIWNFRIISFDCVHINKWKNPQREWDCNVRKEEKYKNIFHYLIRPLWE